jgi:hypothetical protein
MDPRDMDDAEEYARLFLWALEDARDVDGDERDRIMREAELHLSQVAQSMGYTLVKRETLPPLSDIVGGHI